jgi:hypothetical protein
MRHASDIQVSVTSSWQVGYAYCSSSDKSRQTLSRHVRGGKLTGEVSVQTSRLPLLRTACGSLDLSNGIEKLRGWWYACGRMNDMSCKRNHGNQACPLLSLPAWFLTFALFNGGQGERSHRSDKMLIRNSLWWNNLAAVFVQGESGNSKLIKSSVRLALDCACSMCAWPCMYLSILEFWWSPVSTEQERRGHSLPGLASAILDRSISSWLKRLP